MTGTSADGVDAVLVDCSGQQIQVLTSLYTPYTKEMRQEIIKTSQSDHVNLDLLYSLDHRIALTLSESVNLLLRHSDITAEHVLAIGSHGQTIRHRPDIEHLFTAQLGDANIIAAQTGIDVIADFRRADMAHGGQGAPLAPLFHQHALNSENTQRAILNLGGIANITILDGNNDTLLGFDTGPANALMDDWIQSHKGLSYDRDGKWSSQGKVDQALLHTMLRDNYFHKDPPKSTGREYFNLAWVKSYTKHASTSPIDIQATLCQLSADSISLALRKYANKTEQIVLCGGGAKNVDLISRLSAVNTQRDIFSSNQLGFDPDFLEATIFAWLAYRHKHRLPGNAPSVTGCTKPVILGCLYPTST